MDRGLERVIGKVSEGTGENGEKIVVARVSTGPATFPFPGKPLAIEERDRKVSSDQGTSPPGNNSLFYDIPMGKNTNALGYLSLPHPPWTLEVKCPTLLHPCSIESGTRATTSEIERKTGEERGIEGREGVKSQGSS